MPNAALKNPKISMPPIQRELYYGGRWHAPLSGESVEIFNPATGASLGSVAWAGREDVDAAVVAAVAGFKEWRRTKPLERAAILRAAAAVIRKHAEEIALIDATDCGGPFKRMIRDSE